MFTWICPQCGREVLPSYTECPDCSKKTGAGASATPPAATAGSPLGAAAPPQFSPGPAQPPAYAPPPAMPPQATFPPPQPAQPVYQQPPYQQPAYQAPPVYQQPPAPQYYAPPARGGLPTWLLTVVFSFAFLGLGAGIYWIVGYLKNSPSAAATPSASVESPAAKTGAKTNPLQKYIEISGVRFSEDAKKKIIVKFTLTNHSDADIAGLAGNATIWGRTQKSEEDAVGTFSFAGNVKPDSSVELSAPLTTKLKVYELPDWQNVTTDLQITAP